MELSVRLDVGIFHVDLSVDKYQNMDFTTEWKDGNKGIRLSTAASFITGWATREFAKISPETDVASYH